MPRVRGELRLHRSLSAVSTSTPVETAHLELADQPPFFNAHSMLWTLPPSGPALAVTPAMLQTSDAVLLHHRHSEMGVKRGGRVEGGGGG